MTIRRFLFAAVTLLLMTMAALGWLTGSESGLRVTGQLASTLTGGRLQLGKMDGCLAGPFDLSSVRWQDGETRIDIEGLHAEWRPRRLLDGHLDIAALAIDALHIHTPPSNTPTPPPAEIRSPLAIDLRRLSIERIEYNGLSIATKVLARASSDGRQFRLDGLSAHFGAVHLQGDAALDGAAPTRLAAQATLTGRLAGKPLAVSLAADGPLTKIELTLNAQAGLVGKASASLTPFAARPFERVRIALAQLDLAAWQADAPRTALRIDGRFEAIEQGSGVAGRLRLDNDLPGRIDLGRLPLTALSGSVNGNFDSGRFSDLHATLAGGSELTGNGGWQGHRITLDTVVRGLNLAALDGRLQRTRLQGALNASLTGDEQRAQFTLRDSAMSLQAALHRVGDTLTIERLSLNAGQARLAAEGRIGLSEAHEFAMEGSLNQFDPRRFTQFFRLPTMRLNARLRASGQLTPVRKIDLQADLADSLFADQALRGRARLKLDGSRAEHVDIDLSAGPNHLRAQGTFGRPGDTLDIALDAPRIDMYGGEGGIQGQLNLAGAWLGPRPNARLNGWLRAGRLGWPGLFSLRGLDLTADLGVAADAPLKLDAMLDAIRLGRGPDSNAANDANPLRALRLHAEGSNRDQQIALGGDILGKNALRLSARGRFEPETGWQGRILALQLDSADKNRNFRLANPAPLRIASDRWQLGPLALHGETLDWRARLDARADARQFAILADADGGRLGQLHGELAGAMAGAWSLAAEKPWRGFLASDTPDLAWLGDLIGDGWRSGGKLAGRIDLAGTPAKPVANGKLQGDGLKIAHTARGLRLENGRLDIGLFENLLQVRQLHFDSLLTKAPAPVRLAAGGRFATPGQIDLKGELRLGQSGGEDAWLDLSLDRLGVFQQPDQWIALSGKGRLEWREGTLGAHGQLAVDAGYWQLAASNLPRLSDDVVIRRPGDAGNAAGLRPPLDLDVSVDLGENFHFVGAGLTSELAGQLRIAARGRDLPRATGTVRAEKGRYQAYGQTLDIERAHLVFNGLLDNPALDVRAMRRGLAVEAGVQIGGTAYKPLVKLVAEPEVPDAEKLAWLVLGHGPEQMGASDATVLLSAAGGLLGNNASGVTQQLKQRFGIEDVGIRQGKLGETSTRAPSSRVAGLASDAGGSTANQIFSVSKRLSQNMLLSYEQVLGKAESVVKLTLKLSRQVSLVGRAGSDNALDAFYTFSFGGPPAKTAAGR